MILSIGYLTVVIHEMLAFEVHGGVTYMLMHVFPHIKNKKNIGKYMGFYFF